jgi:tRNA threonylcarbamoyladenosine biosynthesis protein TsaE
MEKIALSALDTVAEKVLAALPQDKASAAIIALSGNLGAGSPTYVLMKTYPIAFARYTKFIHIDAYRLIEPAEFKTLKPEEFLSNPTNLVCIEWPEQVAGMLPTPDITINFSSEDAGENERYILLNFPE